MRSFVVGLAILGSLAACDSTTASGSTSLLALEQHQAQWEHRSFHSYSFDYQRSGIGFANAHVIVTNDVVTSVDDSVPRGIPVLLSDYPTIDSLFTTTRSFFGVGHVSVNVDYDAQLGYPKEVSAFSVPANPGGGYQVSVSNLQPIQ
jgi:hypothetical protein